MQNYPPPGGNQGYNQGYDQNQRQGGYGQGQGGYNQGQSGYNQGYNQSSGYGHQPQGGGQGYDQWNPNSAGQNSFGGGSSGYGAPNVYPQQGGGFNSNSQAPSGYPQQQGSFGQQGDPSQWNAQTVPQEHLPPGYNPNTRAPYQPHELPPGAQMAGPGEEGYVPAGMSRDEAQSRGFLGSAGGGLLGMWLGHKFGKKHGHGILGTLGGGGAGAFIGNKLF